MALIAGGLISNVSPYYPILMKGSKAVYAIEWVYADKRVLGSQTYTLPYYASVTGHKVLARTDYKEIIGFQVMIRGYNSWVRYLPIVQRKG